MSEYDWNASKDHWPGCWEEHHECARVHLRAALARIAELEKALEATEDQRAMP